MKYYLKVLQNYAVFHGRARRSEYWFFVLFNVIFSIATSLIDNLMGTTYKMNSSTFGMESGYINTLYSLAVLVPGLAVSVRRLHDVGKRGWFILLVFIPIIGWIWLLVLFFTDSNVGVNKYGPNPKGIGNTDEIDEIGSYLKA